MYKTKEKWGNMAPSKPAGTSARGRPRAPAKTKLPVKRSIGRPPADGNSVGREKLLKTACDLLKTTRPNKLTRLMVAQRANVDPSLIRYYFRDRISLLAAAAERLSDQYVDRLNASLGAVEATGLEQLQARLSLTVGLDVSYAQFRRLVLEELVGSDSPEARAAASKIVLRGAAAYRSIMEDGVADGSVRADDPVMLFISVIAMSSYISSARTVYELATGQRIGQQAMADKYRAFVTGLMSRGMAPS